MTEAITYLNLLTSIPHIKYIQELEIENQMNDHATMRLTGILKDEMGQDAVYDIQNRSSIVISYLHQEVEKGLFCGIITRVTVNLTGQVYSVCIEAKSNTYLLDIYKKSRSFQDINRMSHDLIEEIARDYDNIQIEKNFPNVPVGQLIVQYNETDYEFLRRFASMFHMGLVAQIENNYISFMIGAGDQQTAVVKTGEYSLHKDLESFAYMQGNHIPDLSEQHFVIHEFTSYEILPLGSYIALNQNALFLSKCRYVLKDDLIECCYYAQLKNGLLQQRLYNGRLIGISVEGRVIGVVRDMVKVHMNIDAVQAPDKAYLFPYSTISASADGSGWYCMPELDDQIRIYFPTKDEKDGFSISSVSSYVPEKASDTDLMSDPSVKYIRTCENKQVKFNANGIFISSDDTQARIHLLKSGAIQIIGQNGIYVTAEKDIQLEAKENVHISAKKSIKLEQTADGTGGEGSGIELDEGGNVTIKGIKIQSN